MGPRPTPVHAAVPAFLTSVILLALLVGAGVVAIVTTRARWLRRHDEQGEWERTLAAYKNLRDEGVLSEEEYRNIRTLVEPRLRGSGGVPEGRPGPAAGSVGTNRERK